MKPEELLGTLLREKGLKIALAESCTGGLIASRITDIPGASEYFEAGVVVYSNRAKQRFLSVPEQSIRAHGAVSKEVAEKMAITIPNGQWAVVPDSGHGVHIDNPAGLVAVVRPFLEG